MEKKSVFFLLLLSVILGSCGVEKKSVLKIYAYSQPVRPGILPKTADQMGNVITPAVKPVYNYFLYAENLKKDPVYISDIWLDSLHFPVTTENVNSKPVIFQRYNESDQLDTLILVPQTTHDIFRINPGSATEEEKVKNKKLRNLIRDNELIIGYLFKGKKSYRAVKKLNPLPPNIAQ